jgi:hypothetical protein
VFSQRFHVLAAGGWTAYSLAQSSILTKSRRPLLDSPGLCRQPPHGSNRAKR